MPTENGSKTKFRAISDEIRRAIAAGEYQPGDRLPGENALMEKYGVARETARKALAVLTSEGLAVARRGSGVFVTDFKPLRRNGVARLSKDQWGAGRSIWSADTDGRELSLTDIQVYRDEAPANVSRVLGLDAQDAVWVRHRTYVLDGKPVMVATSYLPANVVDGSAITQVDTGTGGVYARLKDLGFEPIHFREEIRARMPLPEESQQLKLPTGIPVIELYRTAYTKDERAVELNEMTLDASSYILEYAFDS
jgi:GntR family transcriptional regulator